VRDVKVYKVRSGDPQVAVSCLGGCGLLIGWVVVGVANVAFMSRSDTPQWMSVMVGIFWLLSFPVCTVAYLKWRGRRHSRAFKMLEGKMTEKMQERLRKQSPEP
jgi:hypothetical protein